MTKKALAILIAESLNKPDQTEKSYLQKEIKKWLKILNTLEE